MIKYVVIGMLLVSNISFASSKSKDNESSMKDKKPAKSKEQKDKPDVTVLDMSGSDDGPVSEFPTVVAKGKL